MNPYSKTMNKNPNEPPLSHFDKSFSDNPWDVLFCSLNEIEPNFAGMDFPEDKSFSQKQILDPRNNLPVAQSFYDQAIYMRPEIFRCPNRSTLNYKEHSICLAFLQSMKAKKQIFPHQIECFEKTATRRHAEQVEFTNFLSQYNKTSYEKIYAPNLMLVEPYRRFYQREVSLLLDKHPDGIFQIHTGFPVPQKCGTSETSGTISDIECVSDNRTSSSRLDPSLDLSKMKTRMDAYLDLHVNSLMTADAPQKLNSQVNFDISLDALVFLLSAGEYIDIPSEVVVDVVMGADGENVFYINDLLPARNTGPHTAELVAGISTDIFLKTKTDECPPEIQATDFKGPYHLQTIDDFMNSKRNRDDKFSPQPTPVSYSQVKWTLNVENNSRQFHIMSRMKCGYRDNQKMRETFLSLKLEYKPQFGCEVISKANLLREWLQLLLSDSPNSDSSIYRHRINANTFKTVMQENLHLEELELELERRYKLKTSRLLGSLGEFLGLLSNIAPGRYLMHYNPRFQEKLMLYAEVKESTSKSSISLHSLLQETPSDLAFMTLRQLTPIDDVLCTAMHDFYKILPCMFPAGVSNARTTRRVIDDRNFIQKKAKAKLDSRLEKLQKAKARKNSAKRTRRAKKLKQKSKETKEKQTEMTELEDDIKNDRILFGFD